MYLSGEGVDKDESKAMTYFKRGAEKGTIRPPSILILFLDERVTPPGFVSDIHQSGVLIFRVNSQCSLVPNLLNQPIRFLSFPAYPRNLQDKIGPMRFFKDGRQTPNLCIVVV